MRKSPKEIEIENEILAMLSGKQAMAASLIFNDEEAKTETKNLVLKEKVLSFELWFFAFRFKFLV